MTYRPGPVVGSLLTAVVDPYLLARFFSGFC